MLKPSPWLFYLTSRYIKRRLPSIRHDDPTQHHKNQAYSARTTKSAQSPIPTPIPFMMDLLSLHSILLFVSAGLAADAQVAWRLEHDTKASALVAVDTNGTVIAETCGSTIYAKHPIDFSNVDEINGSGNFTIGNATYMVHSNPDWSGGPACSRVFNPQYTLVQCSGVSWDAADAIGDKSRDCFAESPTNGELQFPQNRTLNDGSQMHERGWWDDFKNNVREGFSTTELELVGDGKCSPTNP